MKKNETLRFLNIAFRAAAACFVMQLVIAAMAGVMILAGRNSWAETGMYLLIFGGFMLIPLCGAAMTMAKWSKPVYYYLAVASQGVHFGVFTILFFGGHDVLQYSLLAGLMSSVWLGLLARRALVMEEVVTATAE